MKGHREWRVTRAYYRMDNDAFAEAERAILENAHQLDRYWSHAAVHGMFTANKLDQAPVSSDMLSAYFHDRMLRAAEIGLLPGSENALAAIVCHAKKYGGDRKSSEFGLSYLVGFIDGLNSRDVSRL